MKKIRGNAACRRAADVTRIARTSSPACRSRCFRDRRRACGPPRTASAARTIRAARRRRHAPGVDARRGIVGAIGAHRHARRGGAPSRVRRAARNASPCRGERGTDCRRKLHRFGERALQRTGACMNSAFKKSARRGTEHQNVCRCTNGSGYLDDLDDSDEMRERVAMAQCPPHVMPPAGCPRLPCLGAASDSSLSEAAPASARSARIVTLRR